MKTRKGYQTVDATGTTWQGDCPKWADAVRRSGQKVTAMRIVGSGRWPCGACKHHLSH